MTRLNLGSYIRSTIGDIERKKEAGPYITISREPGCEGYKVGDVLMEMLNKTDEQKRWRVFKKEILKQLAEDSGVTQELIDEELHAVPSLVRDFFKGMGKGTVPDGIEVRSKITTMIRSIAIEGYAIIIGQGGTAATSDIANGLSIRLEAPKEWRILKICRRDNLSREQAIAHINNEEIKRQHIRAIYTQSNPRVPAFNLVIDNSVFSAEQVAELIFKAMQQKKMIK